MSQTNNSQTGISGFIVLDKPSNMSSMKAIAILRRKAGRPKTGHAGTLDPLATGVLVCALGKATKSIARMMDTTKRYRTMIDLSAFTSTDDLEGDTEKITPASIPDRSLPRGVTEPLHRFISPKTARVQRHEDRWSTRVSTRTIRKGSRARASSCRRS